MEKQNKSEIEKALEKVPSYNELRDGDPNLTLGAYKTLRQVEKAYEQLQNSGIDVNEQLKERRYQLLEAIIDTIDTETNLSEIKNRGSLENNSLEGYFSVKALKTAVGLLEEYIGKINPNNPVLKDSTGILED